MGNETGGTLYQTDPIHAEQAGLTNLLAIVHKISNRTILSWPNRHIILSLSHHQHDITRQRTSIELVNAA
jgi:hypothetical protein